jgi:hypothetical protein
MAIRDGLLSELSIHGYAVLDGVDPTDVAVSLGRAGSGELLASRFHESGCPTGGQVSKKCL